MSFYQNVGICLHLSSPIMTGFIDFYFLLTYFAFFIFSISVRKVIRKLSLHSVYPLYLVWIKALLHNRTQNIRIISSLSQPTDYLRGTFQGSVLNSTVFFMYVNDFQRPLRTLQGL